MAIVTLTSDFGWQDYYLAMIKGAILSEAPAVQLVDLTHGVKNYDIVQAAFLFKNAWPSFPKGSIHLISVNDYNPAKKRFLAAAFRGHYFVAPDNGLFSLIFDEDGPKAFHELPYEESEVFPLKKVYARAVAYLSKGRPIIELGPVAEDIEQRITLQPVTSHSQIRGSIIHLDNYENVITNVSRDLFERVGGGRTFKLFFKRHDPILTLSTHYYSVSVGEPLCLFNSAGYLEIAINMGKAASLLGLKVEDTIQIDFHS
jgi:hypothetical protein